MTKNIHGWNNGEFPAVLYLIEPKSNPWLQKGDVIYSAFEMDGKLYASGVKTSKVNTAFGMAFWNDDTVPIKNGIVKDEKVIWGVNINGLIVELILQSTTTKNDSVYATFKCSNEPLEINDNPYYSLDPVWPEITELRINEPITTKALTLAQLMDYRPLIPHWTSGYLVPEIVEGNAKLKISKYFNATTIRFTKADVEKGYFMLKIHATPLKNSASEQLFKTYKIYWK